MNLGNIPPIKGQRIQVVIETPRGSQHKYAFDPEVQLYRLKKSLPMGSTFPFDFGFIPNTKGDDGDPLDVLVLMDEPACQGCIVECRLLAVLLATQREKDGKEIRNDRIIAVASSSAVFGGIKKINQLNKNMGKEIQNFFIDYNKQIGRKFIPRKFGNVRNAIALIRKSIGGDAN